MKTAALALIVAAVVLAPAATAATDPDVAALKRRVTALETRANTLEKRLAAADKKFSKLEKRVAAAEKKVADARLFTSASPPEALMPIVISVLLANVSATACLAASTADAFAVTWSSTDILAQSTANRTFFGPQAAVNDGGSCGEINIARSQTPPNLTGFARLINVFYGE